MSEPLKVALVALLLASTPGRGWAHSPVAGIEGFYLGLAHPLTEPAQWLALTGLGVLLGQGRMAGARQAWLGCAIATVVALIVTVLTSSPRDLGTTLTALAMVTGLLVTLELRAPALLLIPLGILTGAAIGAASVPEPGPLRATLLTAGGSLVAANLLLLYVLATARWLAARAAPAWLPVGLRIVGSWIAAAAAMLLALAWRS